MDATGSDNTTASSGVPINPNSARHVEYLTPVQLYKKRANDRSNQRISRARRKDRIKALEDENQNLKSQLTALETAKASASTLPSPTPSRPHTEQQPPRIWQVLPLWIPPMCRMDNVINRLTDNANEGSSYQELMGEITQLTYPSIPSLLNPESSPTSAPLTSVIGRHGQWMNITSPAAMTAMMYNICMYLRWLISPTKENYLALPAYLRPTPLQLILPHPRWIDMVPWPRAREQLITQMDWDKEFWTYRTHVNSTVSVNWPHLLSDILISDNSDIIILSPQFLQHIHREVNWSVGPGLSEALPYLQCIPLNPK